MKKAIWAGLMAWSTASLAAPQVLMDATNAYKKGGAQSFVATLLKDSVTLQLANMSAADLQRSFESIETTCGPFTGMDVVREVDVSPLSKMVYFSLNYGKCALFSNALFYKSAQGEVLASVAAYTNPYTAWPRFLIEGK
ncbi:hypothetical protein DTO96_100333 [Ephemeroptericola cinctiostellae]|uniref:Uncharacterized protein n=1 Tax=Ephemeroptericola cinctiostellae TaxID=2268024 RepID=A0A345D8D5_9BURK|nr:hypothetical protein [Ephemeroptericola cinctiostellae]AXF84623.1 hypothetical protein DTO96_100333 [Ephemeroptericola cinctiostellae]